MALISLLLRLPLWLLGMEKRGLTPLFRRTPLLDAEQVLAPFGARTGQRRQGQDQ
jgi:hypothetical protein